MNWILGIVSTMNPNNVLFAKDYVSTKLDDSIFKSDFRVALN